MVKSVLVRPINHGRPILVNPFFEEAEFRYEDLLGEHYVVSWAPGGNVRSRILDTASMVAVLKGQGYVQQPAVENTNIPAIDEITPILEAMKETYRPMIGKRDE